MKKVISVILLVATVLSMLLTTACAKNDYLPMAPESAAILERIDNKATKEELITKEYSLSELKYLMDWFSPSLSKTPPLIAVDGGFPIECIRKVSDRFYYVVYKVKEGGYLYLHLTYCRNEEWKEGGGMIVSHSYYAADEQPNIKKIKKGDPFSTVAAYDKSIASADANFFFIPNDNGDKSRCVTLHRQDNKLYMITYEDGSSIDAIKQSTVKSVKRLFNLKFSPEFEYDKEIGFAYSYKILKIDQ